MGNILGYYVMPHPPIVIPEVGRGEEKKIQNTTNACTAVAEEIKDLRPDTIIIVTPHGPLFRDAVALTDADRISGDLDKFLASNVKFNISINQSLVDSIMSFSSLMNIPAVRITQSSAKGYKIPFELDHGSMIPLYFVNEKYTDYKLVHITYGLLSKIDLYKFGLAIRKAVEASDSNSVVIASGDLSHKLTHDGPYGYDESGAKFDKEIISMLEKGDVYSIFSMDRSLVDAAGECGMRSFYTLLGTMDGCSIKGKLLSYEGPFGVGYGVLRFDTTNEGESNRLLKLENMRDEEVQKMRQSEDNYVRLARESLEYFIEHDEYIEMPDYVYGELLNDRRGVFVSLKKDGELRGCIGTVSPVTESCASEIIRNAVEAGTRDPRFFPVESDELNEIVYSVDVLMPPEKASKEDLDPKRYGVIVSTPTKAGLLLPDLEGVDTVGEQLEIALKKAGISSKEKYEIERFEVIRHK